MDFSATHSVSLKELFPTAQFIGADDIRCSACDQFPESHSSDWVFATGLSPWSAPERDVLLAQSHGALGILTEQYLPTSLPQCIVDNVGDAFAQLAMKLAGNPCDKILTIGVVGTHGKTTAGLMIASMLKRIGKTVAYHTSLGASTGSQTGLAADANADAMVLAAWLKQSVSEQAPAAVLEITDEMLKSHATSGIEFDVLVFTSLRRTQRADCMQARGIENAMSRLVDQLKEHGVVIVNADDARLNRWAARCYPEAISYGIDAQADVQGKRMRAMRGEQSLMVSAGNCVAPMTSTILGDHNARHMLSAVSVGYSLGLELYETVCGVERLHRIPGRLQRLPSDHDTAIYVDHADQADRLAVALHALCKDGTPVTCVAEIPDAATPEQLAAFGRVLEKSASFVILTQSRRSVRFGQTALWQVLDGCDRPCTIQIVPNRRAAIDLAIRSAQPGEAILLAGWGADRWTTEKVPQPQSDIEVATELVQEFARDKAPPMVELPVPALKIFRGMAG